MNIQAVYDYAKLATFSYVDLSAKSLPISIETIVDVAATKDNPGATERISTALGRQMFDSRFAADITGRWTLRDPYYKHSSETGHSDPASGFAAMLLENATYGKVLAIAGTEPGGPGQKVADLLEADGREIGFWGIAFKQVVSLFNYVQELRAPEGQPVVHLTVHEGLVPGNLDAAFLPAGSTSWLWLESDMSGVGRELLNPSEKLSVTGHSLGGHLAAVAVALFPDLFTEAFTFNAPGFNPDFSRINFPLGGADQLLNMLRPYGAQPISVESIAPRVHTLEAEDVLSGDDYDAIAGNVTGQPFSQEHYISTENVSHDVGHMMDSLAVQAFMARLNPSLSDLDTGAMLDALSSPADAVLETVVERLYIQLFGSAITLDRTTAGLVDAGDFAIRSQLFDRLIEMQNQLPNLPHVHLYSLVSLSPNDIKSLAEDTGPNGLGYRYALEQLNPFAVTGGHLPDDAANRLALYDRQTGTGQITQQWLTDRAEMLHWKLELGLIDAVTDAEHPSYISNGRPLWLEDRTSALTLHLGALSDAPHILFGKDNKDAGDVLLTGALGGRLYGGAGNDTLFGQSGDDYLEGGADDDYLTGNAGADTLLGMDGSDKLNGGTGNDLLEGGRGEDFYRFATGDGFDRVFDVDGNNHILINSVAAPVGKQVGPNANVWVSADDSVRFTLSDKDNGKQSLLISYGSNDRILIQDFTLGAFGLSLEDYQPPETPPEPDFNEINGDLAPKDFGADPGVQSESDEWGNTIPSGVPEPDLKDGLRDTVADDWIQGFGGEDLLRGGQGGNDKYDGGTADDEIFDGGGNDTLIGGEGADQLRADAGDDQLFADDFVLLEDATVPNEHAGVDARGDWLDGGADDDLLVGSKARDMLLGDEGDDTLAGGEGNDYLMGDGATQWLRKEWTVETMVTPLPDSWVRYTVSFVDAFALAALSEGGKDVLYGGAGNDCLDGDAGDDWLDGGSGFDLVWGGAGNDTLSGGLGNDVVVGDNADWEEGLPSALHGHDVLDGGEGHDSLNGNGGNDIILGGDGNDILRGDDSDLNGQFGNAYLYHGADFLDGGTGEDTLQGGGRNDTLMGGAGKDVLVGDYADLEKAYHGGDLLDGGSENDTLFGMGGDDTLHGGTDDDQLFGDMDQLAADKHGDDWLYGGAGNDTLAGGGGTDRLYGGEDNDHLQGDSLGLTELEQHGDYLDGGQGNDTLLGMGGADTLFGGAGDDNLSGDANDDVLDGGAGKDVLHGGAGNDRFIFATGYGLDALTDTGGDSVVQFGAGISVDSLQIGVDEGANRLYLSSSPDDTLVLDNYTGWGDTEFQFADGSRLGMAELMVRINRSVNQSGGNGADRLYGANLNDSLHGDAGDDLLTGQGGADRLNGGAGNDEYFFSIGDGADVISDREGINVVSFGEGILSSSLIFSETHSSLGDRYLMVNYNGGSVAIKDGLLGAVSEFQFADGSSLSFSDALRHLPGLKLEALDSDSRLYGSDGNDQLNGSLGNDWLESAAGDDSLRGGKGQDTLLGGGGGDSLWGGEGEDSLVGAEGDDLLDGGSGNDTLSGGAGNNTYLFSLGMGQDLILAGDNGTNVLQLGFNVDQRDIKSKQDGDDLLIEFKGFTSGVRIQDYFSVNQSWSVTSGGETFTMPDFLQRLTANVGMSIDAWERRFKQEVYLNYANYWLDRGASSVGDGTFRKLSIEEYGGRYRSEKETFYSIEYREEHIPASSEYNDEVFGYVSCVTGHGESTYVELERTRTKIYERDTAGMDVFHAGGGGAEPRFYEAGLGGFHYISGETVVAVKDSDDEVVGYWVYPEGSFNATTESLNVREQVFVRASSTSKTVLSIGIGVDSGMEVIVLGENIFHGGSGADVVKGQSSSVAGALGGFLSGGAGDDYIYGGDARDMLIGGAGNDFLNGREGNDQYVIIQGDGVDVISDTTCWDYYLLRETRRNTSPYELSGAGFDDVVILPEGVNLAGLQLAWGVVEVKGNNLQAYESGNLRPKTQAIMAYASLDISWGTEQKIKVVMPHDGEPQGSGVDFLQLASGEKLSLNQLIQLGNLGDKPNPYSDGAYLRGGFNPNEPLGPSEDYATLAGGVGNDTIESSYINLYGGDGDDFIREISISSEVSGALTSSGDSLILDGLEVGAIIVGNSLMSGWPKVGATIIGGKGHDTLHGGAGLNWIGYSIEEYYGGGNVYSGGGGDDFIYGSHAGDTYHYSLGDGRDEIRDLYHNVPYMNYDVIDRGVGYAIWAGMPEHIAQALYRRDYSVVNVEPEYDGKDTLVFAKGISAEMLYFEFEGRDLLVKFIGDEGSIRFKEWALHASKPLKEIVFADGTVWGEERLVQLEPLGNAGLKVQGSSLADVLNGYAGSEYLVGGAGDDVLDGKAGADTLMGGAGNDTYIVDNAADLVTELAGEGIDTVKSSISYSLTANTEKLILLGTAAINATGNAEDNSLYGNVAANILTGDAGDDVLDGKAGADTLIGGTGNDSYVVDNAADLVTELAGEGIDTVKSSISYNLGDNVEKLILLGTAAINATGNAEDNGLSGNIAANILTGDAGDDVLDGKAGADTLIGGTGNDTYVVDSGADLVTELAGEGADTIKSAISWTLGDNFENLTLIGGLAISGTGNAGDNLLTGNAADNSLSGGDGNDTLNGGLGADQLFGGAGDDSLNGGAGQDNMIGGSGNDTYVVDSGADLVTELAGEGIDTVKSSISYSLSDNVENLSLLGTAAINATGNAANNSLHGNVAANILTGDAGDDVLDGKAGADNLIGGSGDDSYVVDNAADLVTELAGEGTDTIKSAISWTLGDNLENLTLTGSLAINGTGNAGDNLLTGNAADNSLSGGDGNDTLNGGLGADQLFGGTGDDSLNGGAGQDTLFGGIGNDTYVVDNATDLVVENSTEGTDRVKSSVSYSLTADVENLTLTGTAEINATGNELANTLKGNVAANTLSGGLGNDSLYGGLGNDTYLFARGDGADKITENDATVGNHDSLIFSGVNHDQLWFRSVGSNLEVSVIGTGDKVSITSWNLGASNHVEQILASDGLALNDAQVANLVNAMAAFAPPAAGQTSLSSTYHAALDSVIAANWQ